MTESNTHSLRILTSLSFYLDDSNLTGNNYLEGSISLNGNVINGCICKIMNKYLHNQK